jgi:hypothetical protein
MNLSEPLNRRRIVAGTLGAALVATTGLGIAGAQDDEATPDADETTDSATPDSGVGGVQTDEETDAADDLDRATAAVEQATAAIATVQADRDAVAGQIDALTVDALLAQATALRDRAQTAADGGDAGEARRLARAAGAMAKAAGDLVAAQLVTAGLPSQEAPASRVLAAAFETVQVVTEETAAATDADVTFSVTTAQALYQTAFDLYGAGAYGQAAGTARVASRLARIGAFLADPTAEDDDGPGGRRGGQRDGFAGRDGGPGDDDGPEDDQDAPVTVPEPSF